MQNSRVFEQKIFDSMNLASPLDPSGHFDQPGGQINPNSPNQPNRWRYRLGCEGKVVSNIISEKFVHIRYLK